MEQFVINGPKRLKGTVSISGSKNAALPIIAATVLIPGKSVVKNVPGINDVRSMLKILEKSGSKYTFDKNTLTIDNTNLRDDDPDKDLVRHLRASILFIAPFLIRNKKVSLPHPGGCLIGARPIDVHLTALAKMGAKVTEEDGSYEIVADEILPCEICADFSVTGTENIIMAAIFAKGESVIRLAAAEPHVQDLCNFLIKAGAKISGVGTHDLTITGVTKLNQVEYEIIPDQIEAGTFAIAAAASKGDVRINGFIPRHQESLLSKFDQCGVLYELGDSHIFIKPTMQLKSFKIRTEIYPGFPTDLQAPMAILATQANGTSEIYETIFEGRLGYINELSKMGASCVVRDAHQASITGPTPLFGTRITSFDLRAGATLIIAAIISQGESRLDQIEMIDRGYENIEAKFNLLGADIKRVKLKEIE
jgi:UDP-N-acetylglucosamine 1-carboxyvinyltransferase